MLQRAKNYEELCSAFKWHIPAAYNIGVDVMDRHVSAGNGDHVALIYETDDGKPASHYTFAQLQSASARLANALCGLGVQRGDRVAILLPQGPQTAMAHVATYKLGAIALPLFTLFGPEALQYRLANSEAAVVITNAQNVDKVMALRKELPALRQVIVTGQTPVAGTRSIEDLLDEASDRFSPVLTGADDPALIIYTSGTTGNPKGALHAHRVLLGHLPGVEMPHEFFPQPGDCFWTPADWAWIGGLLDVLLPAWHHGAPVLAHRARKFDPEYALTLMARHNVRNVFLPPTAIKLMRQLPPDVLQQHKAKLRSIGSGGETLGNELLDWGRRTFGLTINEFYGQTECNLVVANCASLMEARPGSMGRAVPGHTVAIINEQGEPLPDGQTGHIAVRMPDPVMFLRYWNLPQATQAKFIGDWLLTGDVGRRDTEGYFWFVGRDDDVITSAGYRIGPAEIEDCLMKHPAVAMVAVIGVPDPLRTEIVKAFIVLSSGTEPTQTLSRELQEFVKQRLAAHEYPRLIEFVDSLPMTTTGKLIRRELRQREMDRIRKASDA